MWAEDAQYLISAGWTKLAEWTTDEDATAQRSKPKPVQTVAQPGSMPFIGEICENSATLAFSCI